MHGRIERDWYKHQVTTSHTFAPKSLICFIFTGGLNLQIEHHLFPGLNSWHLRIIQPVVQEVCEKHSVPYNLSNTLLGALSKHLYHMP
jgi:fatty acid desaturase